MEKEIGSKISAATLMYSGHIRAKVTRVGSDTTLAQVIALVDEATSSKEMCIRDRITPTHVCLIVSLDYFKADFFKTLIPVIVAEAALLGVFSIYSYLTWAG